MASQPSRVPPGFRFHPTDEELVNYYLKKKVNLEKFDLDVIRDVDLNKLEPWDLHERCRIDTAQQTDWYFFSHKDKKYPTGTRTNRATAAGFWKATGRDKAVHAAHMKRIGMRKTLVFYIGRAPHGQKTDWIMHEYRLEDSAYNIIYPNGPVPSNEDGWVVCRVFKKRIHHQKATQHSQTTLLASEEEQSSLIDNNPTIDHHKNFEVKSAPTTTSNSLKFPCKREEEYEDSLPQVQFLHLPQLESPKNTTTNNILFPDVVDFHGRGSLASIEPLCFKRSEIFPPPFTLIEMPTLDTSNYTKSLIFGCDDNLLDATYIEENDQWGVLESLPKDMRYHPSSSDNLCNSLLSTNCDVEIWKPLL